MKHLRKFENFSDLNMDFPDRLNSQCEKCGQELCNCEPECEPCDTDTDKNVKENPDYWYYFDHPDDMPKDERDDNDGESYDDDVDDEEDDDYNWGDKNIEIKRESNLITFKDFINEKKKGEVPEGLQKYFDEKSGKKTPAKKSKSKEDEENVKPDFLDLNKNGDKKEPMKKAAKEAKEKAAKEKSSKK